MNEEGNIMEMKLLVRIYSQLGDIWSYMQFLTTLLIIIAGLFLATLLAFRCRLKLDRKADHNRASKKLPQKEDEKENKTVRPANESQDSKVLIPSKDPAASEKAERSKKIVGAVVYKICITGGPCAGKTSVLTYCAARLSELGIKVFVVPEAATMLNQGGVCIANAHLSDLGVLKFQLDLMNLQMKLEDAFVNLALERYPTDPIIVLCDRGIMDGSAYMTPAAWQGLLDEAGHSTKEVRDQRYDAVIHMVTAADGAREFYGAASNESRYESADEAIATDKRTQQAWVGHPQFIIIDNSVPGFEKKLERTLAVILETVGLPFGEKGFTRKLLLVASCLEDIDEETKDKRPKRCEMFTVEETFLIPQDPQEKTVRVSKRMQADSCLFTLSREIKINEKDIIQKRTRISATEFYELKKTRTDKSKNVLLKKRLCMIYESHSAIIDEYQNLPGHPIVMRLFMPPRMEKKSAVCPNLLPLVFKDITGDEMYSNEKMADLNWKMPEEDAIMLKDIDKKVRKMSTVEKIEENEKALKKAGLASCPPEEAVRGDLVKNQSQAGPPSQFMQAKENLPPKAAERLEASRIFYSNERHAGKTTEEEKKGKPREMKASVTPQVMPAVVPNSQKPRTPGLSKKELMKIKLDFAGTLLKPIEDKDHAVDELGKVQFNLDEAGVDQKKKRDPGKGNVYKKELDCIGN